MKKKIAKKKATPVKKKTATKTCGRCRRAGHNVRTCAYKVKR